MMQNQALRLEMTDAIADRVLRAVALDLGLEVMIVDEQLQVLRDALANLEGRFGGKP